MMDHAARAAGSLRPGIVICTAVAGIAAGAWAGASCPIAGSSCPTCTDPAGAYLEGEPAPGTIENYQSFDRPNINASGVVAYTADTDGATSSDDVIYVGSTLIARENDPAPGVPGGAYGAFEAFETSHQLNAGGGIAYINSLLDVPTTANRAVYKNDTLVAREGDPADGIPGRLYVDFGFVGLTDAGVVGYLADLDGSTADDSVIYLGGAVLYRQGDAVPPLPGIPGGTIWDGDFDEIQWNGAGDLLFEGNTSLATNDWVLFRRLADGSEAIVAQEGDPIAATGGPDTLESILQSALAANGDWGMRGTLAVAASTADAIIITASGFQRQEGEGVDELPGVVLGNFNGLDVNSNGDVLYLADLEGAVPAGVDEGLFLNCCLLLTDGGQVPGLPDGTTFSDIGFEDLYINDAQQIVFAANYTGTVIGDGLFTIDCAVMGCPADTNGDNTVNVDDLVNVILDWGTDGSANNGDITNDGIVDVDDLVAVIVGWGDCPGGPAPVACQSGTADIIFELAGRPIFDPFPNGALYFTDISTGISGTNGPCAPPLEQLGGGIANLRYTAKGGNLQQVTNNIFDPTGGTGPVDETNGRRYAGSARLGIGYKSNITIVDGNLNVQITDITWTTKILLPNWTPPKGTPPAQVMEWNRFRTALNTHEKGHAAINDAHMPMVEKRFENQPAGRVTVPGDDVPEYDEDGDPVPEDAARAAEIDSVVFDAVFANAAIAALEMAQDNYDAPPSKTNPTGTDHGATQGATLNPNP